MAEPVTGDTRRLPPFEDEQLDAAKKPAVVAFLRGLDLEPRLAARHLRRWAEVVGVALERADYVALSVALPWRVRD